MNNIETHLKQLIIDTLNLEDLSTDDIVSSEPLFGDNEGLNLDSIDALELGLAIKKHFKVFINGDDPTVREHFASVDSLSKFIQQHGETGV